MVWHTKRAAPPYVARKLVAGNRDTRNGHEGSLQRLNLPRGVRFISQVILGLLAIIAPIQASLAGQDDLDGLYLQSPPSRHILAYYELITDEKNGSVVLHGTHFFEICTQGSRMVVKSDLSGSVDSSHKSILLKLTNIHEAEHPDLPLEPETYHADIVSGGFVQRAETSDGRVHLNRFVRATENQVNSAVEKLCE